MNVHKFAAVLLLIVVFAVGCDMVPVSQPEPEPTVVTPTEDPTAGRIEDIPMPSPVAPELLAEIPGLIDQVQDHLELARYAEAAAAVDRILEILPDYAYGYGTRAMIYSLWAETESDPQIAFEYFENSLVDTHTAIDTGPVIGDYHALAFLFESEYAAITEENYLDRMDHVAEEIEHILDAIDLVTTGEQLQISLGVKLVDAYRCREAFDYFDRLTAKEGETAAGSGGINFGLAAVHLCLGNYDSAITYMSVAIKETPNQLLYLLMAEIYFQNGDYEETIDTLNNSFSTHGDHSGWRFYLRAAAYYKLGDTAKALEDIERGMAQTTIENHLRAYVLGLIALDEGRQLEGLAFLEAAQRTLPASEFPALLREIEEVFAAYEHPYNYTLPNPPLFSNYPVYTAAEMTLPDLPVGGGPVIYVNYAGSGYIFPYGQDYIERFSTYAFTHRRSIDLDQVDTLDLVLQGYFIDTGSQAGELGLNVRIYNFSKETWDELPGLSFGRNPVHNPAEYFSEEGFVYLNIFDVEGGAPVLLSNVALEVLGRDCSGAPIFLGFGQE